MFCDYKERDDIKDAIKNKILTVCECSSFEYMKSTNQSLIIKKNSIVNHIMSSEDPVFIIQNLAKEIYENDFNMPEETQIEYFVMYLIDQIESHLIEFHLVTDLITIVLNIYHCMKGNSEIIVVNNEYLINRLTYIATQLFKGNKPMNIEFSLKLIDLCGLIISRNANFLYFLYSVSIIPTFMDLIEMVDTEFDTAPIFKFFNMLINMNMVNDDFYNILRLMIRYINSHIYIDRYRSIKLFTKSVKNKVINPSDMPIVIKKVIDACIIDDPDDVFTFDVICNFFYSILDYVDNLDEIILNNNFIELMFYNMEKVTYIPGKYSGIDKIILLMIDYIPSILTSKGLLSYLLLNNDTALSKYWKALLLTKLFDDNEISLKFPIDQFNQICQLLMLKDDLFYPLTHIIGIIADANPENYLESSIFKSILMELLEEGITHEEFLILSNNIKINQVLYDLDMNVPSE